MSLLDDIKKEIKGITKESKIQQLKRLAYLKGQEIALLGNTEVKESDIPIIKEFYKGKKSILN